MSASSLFYSPVVRSYMKGHHVHAHTHSWPQFLYASSGVMRVDTFKGVWVVPPQHAVWLPSKCMHEIQTLTDVKIASLYLKESQLWEDYQCEVLKITPLLRELILSLLEIEAGSQWQDRNDLVSQLIIKELAAAKRIPGPIPLPQNPRLLALCRKILLAPSAHVTLDDLAVTAGASPKTITRMFNRELGMSFREWRDLVHVATARAYLDQGQPVKVVASLLGYTSSAFSTMMRRNIEKKTSPLNVTPSLRNPRAASDQVDST